jgi:ribosomal protein S27E
MQKCWFKGSACDIGRFLKVEKSVNKKNKCNASQINLSFQAISCLICSYTFSKSRSKHVLKLLYRFTAALWVRVHTFLKNPKWATWVPTHCNPPKNNVIIYGNFRIRKTCQVWGQACCEPGWRRVSSLPNQTVDWSSSPADWTLCGACSRGKKRLPCFNLYSKVGESVLVALDKNLSVHGIDTLLFLGFWKLHSSLLYSQIKNVDTLFFS